MGRGRVLLWGSGATLRGLGIVETTSEATHGLSSIGQSNESDFDLAGVGGLPRSSFTTFVFKYLATKEFTVPSGYRTRLAISASSCSSVRALADGTLPKMSFREYRAFSHSQRQICSSDRPAHVVGLADRRTGVSVHAMTIL
jgi:hypothetical protein